jgi:uncharacterized protein YjiS (DUF1127 family)
MQQAATRKTSPLAAVPAATHGGALLRAPFTLLTRLAAWQRQAEERSHMLRLSAHELHDLGLSRADVEEMARKPFWHR